jgi:hypothetical protein
MTRNEIWTCDICGKEFRKNDYGYAQHFGFSIDIPSDYSGGDMEFKWDDTCSDCRRKLAKAILNAINDINGIGQGEKNV